MLLRHDDSHPNPDNLDGTLTRGVILCKWMSEMDFIAMAVPNDFDAMESFRLHPGELREDGDDDAESFGE